MNTSTTGMGRTRCAGRRVGTPALCSGRVAPLLAGVGVPYPLCPVRRCDHVLPHEAGSGTAGAPDAWRTLAEKEQSQRLIMYDRNGAGWCVHTRRKTASARPAGRTVAAARPGRHLGPHGNGLRSHLNRRLGMREQVVTPVGMGGFAPYGSPIVSEPGIPYASAHYDAWRGLWNRCSSLRLDALHGRRPPPSHRGR